jgi:TPR repeat protein
MKNLDTGETEEISAEEFARMVRSGNGSIQQIVTNADGSTSSTTLYGNDSDDGLDHSVNIFIDQDSACAFLRRKFNKVTGKMEDPESEKDPNDYYEMTVDFTDIAVMGILKFTKEELSITFYTRDEKKATYDSLKIASKSWKVNPDGTFAFDLSDLQGEDQTASSYMLAFLEMRQFLRASGTLAELKKLGNRGTGVIIKATGQAEDASATIVRGKNRPDLPCNVFLLGEQMMRPYIDEMMSDMMLSGMSLEEKIKAAEDGDTDCMENLATAYLTGDGVTQDFKQSAYWWGKLAETGYSIAQFNLGLFYAKGCGVNRDFEKAAEWMKKAGDNGDKDAQTPYEMYKNASENLKKAESGDAAAQAEMAKLYTQLGGSLNQFGAGQDFQEAFMWAKKSADQGNLDGMYCLALCYGNGRGTDLSPEMAVTIYEKAAKQGHAPSQWNLAVCYLDGTGVQQDETTGLFWAYQAADQGNELAIKGLEAQGKSIQQIIERLANPEYIVKLEGTQYEGRAERCETIQVGTELQYKIVKDKKGEDAIECFYHGGSVGLLSPWAVGEVIALLRLERVALEIKVKSCIPKSKRGARARNADVQLTLNLTEQVPEQPEERAARLKAEEEARRKEEERKAEEERKKAEEAETKAKRKEEEKAAYLGAYAEWEKECKKIKDQRKKLVEERVVAKQSELEQQALRTYQKTKKKHEEQIADYSKRKSDAQAKLATLGFFQLKDKKEQRALIEEADRLCAEATTALEQAEKVYQEERKAAPDNAKAGAKEIRTTVGQELPLPPKPEMPECMKEKKKDLGQIVLEWMEFDRPYLIPEIMAECPDVDNMSRSQVSRLMFDLVKAGQVDRVEERGKAYFIRRA